jgi:hypothetical protein
MAVEDGDEKEKKKKTTATKHARRRRGRRCPNCKANAAANTAAGPPRASPGKSRNRRGLRAKTYSLPHETQDAAERADAWHDHYRPDSPAALHLTNEAARASVLADRVEAFRQACIEGQVDRVVRNQKRRGPRRVKAILNRKVEDKVRTLRDMERFSDGCARIAHEFRVLRDTVASRSYLVPEEVAIAFLWYGIWPVEESLATHVTGYTLFMLNLRCTPGVAPEEWAARVDPANRPVVLRRISSEDLVPADPRVCAERLCAMLQKKREEYQAEADRLRREVEEPAHQRKLKKASILTGADARWASRNYTDARIGFDRAHKALYQTLERDRELELELAGNDENGSSGQRGSDELSGSDVPVTAPASDPIPVPPEEASQSPGEVQGAAENARPYGDQKSPDETRIAPSDLTEVPPSRQVTAQESDPVQGVPFCAQSGVAAPPMDRPPAPRPHAFAKSRSAIQSRFHGLGPSPVPGQAPGPGRPPGVLLLCLLALGCLALWATPLGADLPPSPSSETVGLPMAPAGRPSVAPAALFGRARLLPSLRGYRAYDGLGRSLARPGTHPPWDRHPGRPGWSVFSGALPGPRRRGFREPRSRLVAGVLHPSGVRDSPDTTDG